jgi:hypothetical protein
MRRAGAPKDPGIRSGSCYSSRRIHRAPRGHAPYVNAPWLEEKVWADARQFLRDPGAVLERVREEIESDVASAELEAQREHARVAEAAETWLMTLRDRVE